jgi:hypothetical protein
MIGRTVYGTSGTPVLLTFDGRPELKAGGITIDWPSVTAVSGSDLVTPEGYTVKVGQKWLRYGQCMVKISTAQTITITVSGTPTGGSFTINVIRPDTGQTGTVVIPFNSSVANTQTLLRAFFGATEVTVTGAGALPGNVQTATFGGLLTGVIVPVFVLAQNALTGGTTPTAAFAVGAGGNTGKFGPHDPGASDGRQTVDATRIGEVFVLNESIVQNGIVGIGSSVEINTDQVGGAIFGGRVWHDRLLANASADSLANGPTYAHLLAACPRLFPVKN